MKLNICKNCDRKGKCFFERHNLVCKKLLEILKKGKNENITS